MTNKLISRYRNISSPVKASAWFLVCSVFNKAIQFITMPLFTRLLSTEEYGLYQLFCSWQSICLIFVGLSLSSNIMNNILIHDEFKVNYDEKVSSIIMLITTIGIGELILGLIFKKQVIQLLEMPIDIVVLMITSCILSSAFEVWAVKERFDYHYKKIVIVTVTMIVSNPLLGFIFVMNANGDKGYARIYSVLLIYIIIYGIIYIKQIITGRTFYNKKIWSYALSLAIPLLPHYLSQMVLNQSDRIMIAKLSTKEEVAYYSVAYSVAVVAIFINKAVNESFTPWIYRCIKNKAMMRVKDISNVLIGFICNLNILIMLIGPEIISFLAPSSYQSAQKIIPPVAASSFLIFLYGLFCNLEFYFEKKYPMMIISALGAILNILLNYFGIPAMGSIFAAYSTLISYVFFALTHYVVMRRIEKLNLNGQHTYDIRFIISCSLLIIAISFLLEMVNISFCLRMICFIVILSINCLMGYKFLIRRSKWELKD